MSREGVSDLILVLFGVCVWDYVTSLWFEYRLLTKKIRFRWLFVPYFLARYTLLVYIILYVTEVFSNFDGSYGCAYAAPIDPGFFLGLMLLVFSTWNFLTRTIVIWGNHPLVMKSLLVVGFLHLAIGLIVASVGGPRCNAGRASPLGIMMFGMTTSLIELGVLVLSLAGIRRSSKRGESYLARLLKIQGAANFILVLSLHLATIAVNFAISDRTTGLCVAVFSTVLAPVFSCRMVTSTLSENCHCDCNSEVRMHRIQRLELSEDQTDSGRITTCIDIPKDQTIC